MRASRRIASQGLPSLLAALLLALAPACTESKRPDAESAARSTPSPTTAAATPEAAAAPAAPRATPGPELVEASPADLRDCVKRVYQDAVTVEEGRPDNYVTGDFNGDGSQDIAVVVRPVRGKLNEINDELANWILIDPHELLAPDAAKAPAKTDATPARVSVAQGDRLLAVIHGHKAEGWRDPAATQTYLLKNAAGSNLKARPRATGRRPDVISQTLRGEEGFLLWTGARYDWRPRN